MWPAVTSLALLLNLFCLAQWPFWVKPQEGHPLLERAGNGWSPIQALPAELSDSKLLRPRQHALSALEEVCQGSELAPEAAAEPKVESSTWAELANPLFQLDAVSLRLLPLPGPEGNKIAQGRRWITLGLSSIKRLKTSYLGITLSRLLNVMELEHEPTAVVVHLADFNEAWVQEEAAWLLKVFTDQVHEGRLHAIHAPQSLYPLKQVPLSGVTLKGFRNPAINARFAYRSDRQLTGRPTYWTETHFLYWCHSSGSVDMHRRWGVAEVAQWEEVKQSNCKFCVKAPSDVDVLDPRVTGWEERSGEKWILMDTAGVANMDLQEGETVKFGDGPQRQWWRTKQNLDYAFLMWYAANMSEYYMQLEDDVQPVPHFAAGVRSFIDRSLVGEPWLMASFSSMGFIGKLFNATRLPQLAQVLLIFSTESPCDWLVWDWIDAISDKPFSGDTPGEVEKHLKAGQPVRSDLQLYYMVAGEPKLFLTEPAAIDVKKPGLFNSLNGVKGIKHPVAFTHSSMSPFMPYTEDKAYPPGDPVGFWSSDVTLPEIPPGTKHPEDFDKYVQLLFKRPADVVRIEIHGGHPGKPDDYIHHGALKVSYDRSCKTMDTLMELSKPLEVWEGRNPQEIECLRIYLTKSQNQWVGIREIVIVTRDKQALFSSGTSPVPSTSEVKGGTAAHGAIMHALTAAGLGLLASVAAWLAVWQTRERWERSGGFGCWATTFAAVLDVALIQTLAPTQEDNALHKPAVPGKGDEVDSEIKAMPPQKPSLPPGHISQLPKKPCGRGVRQPRLQIDWRAMAPGIAAVNPEQLRHLGPSSDPRSISSSSSSQRKFMSVGIVVDASMDANSVAEAAIRLARSGQGKAAVAVLVSPRHSSKGGKTDHETFVDRLRRLLASAETSEASLLHLLEPSEELYPPPPMKTKNVDLALLSMFAAPLAHNFMQVEPLCSMAQGYVDSIRTYTGQLDDSHTPWIVVHFTKDGHLRKLVRSRLVHRWAELLVIFPDMPADALFWNFIDIVGDATVPKALYIGTAAETHQRFDVKVQYVLNEPLLEHLGDMSSLQGKVQRAQEIFFKDHVLGDDLFDNPPGIMKTSLQGRQDLLQSLYDGSRPQAFVSCGNFSASTCGECPYWDGAGCRGGECAWGGGLCTATFKTVQVLDEPSSGEAWIELVFDEGPLDIEIVNLRMGGQVVPQDCKGDDCSQAEKPDVDLDHALDDAELLFGHGVAAPNKKGLGCAEYVQMRHVSGREVFWRTASSRPAKGVRCIKVATHRPQHRPLILRHFQVRSTHAGKKRLASKSLQPSLVRVPSMGSPSLRQQLAITDSQQVQRLEWFLVVSLACVSGAFGGVFGALFDTVRPRRKRRQ